MRGHQRARDRQKGLHGDHGRQPFLATENGAERLAEEQLHHNIGIASVRLAEVEDTHDRRVHEAGSRPRFDQQSLASLSRRVVPTIEFDGHIDIEREVSRLEDRAHPSTADDALKAVFARNEIARQIGSLGARFFYLRRLFSQGRIERRRMQTISSSSEARRAGNKVPAEEAFGVSSRSDKSWGNGTVAIVQRKVSAEHEKNTRSCRPGRQPQDSRWRSATDAGDFAPSRAT